MTCIVGLKHDGQVYIGGDSLGSNGYSKIVRTDEKVFRNGPFVMGFTTSFRMGQLLHHAFVPPSLPDENLDRYMTVDFINGIRQCLKDGGWAQTNDSQEVGGTFLVGVRDQLYTIESDYQVGKAAISYDACGSGEDFAKGSLFSTPGQEPKVRIRTALKAAAANSVSVAGPFSILKVPHVR
jgi:ATP-dependent protease HslVU (ClpYQ) peptidase subunit